MPVTLHATCYMTPRRASEKHQTSFVSVVCNISIDTAHGTIHTTTVYTKHFRLWGCGEAGDKSSAGDSAVIQVSAMTIFSWSISILVSAVTAAAELRQGLLLNQTVLQGRKVKYLHRFCLSAMPRAPGQVTLPCPLSPAHASGQIQWQQAGFGLGFDPGLPEYPRYRYDRSCE